MSDLHAPWAVESPPGDSHAFDVYDAMGNKIHHGWWGGKEVACLIAAAPDLLAACKEFVRKCDVGEARSVRSYAQMSDAIAKAEGRS